MLKPPIIYIRPERGGIAEYARRIEVIYGQEGFELEVVIVGEKWHKEDLVRLVESQPSALCHFEVGAADGRIWQASRLIVDKMTRPQLVTIHDPSVVVWNTSDLSAAHSSNAAVRFGGKALRKIAGKLTSKPFEEHLNNPLVTKLYLRPDYADSPNSFYLPQPTYNKEKPSPRPVKKAPISIGFSGFWGLGKGLETLIEAWDIWDNHSKLKLIVADGAAEPNDPYEARLRRRLKSLSPQPELPGLLGPYKLDGFLTNLDVLVLPYWPELASGTSAMAMRAAELGVPIIASNTPALREQLGPDGAVYVEPKSPQALARAFDDVLENWQKVQLQARHTQDRIFASHNWKVVGEKLSTIIATIIGEGA